MAQLQLTLTINTPADVTVADVVQALAARWHYQPQIDGQPNPETRQQFVRRRITEYVRDAYREARLSEGLETARQQLVADADRVTVT